MSELSNPFDCRVPHAYESLALIDEISEVDGADKFFDAASTPTRKESEPNDLFFTPIAAAEPETAKFGAYLSPIVEEGSGSDRRKSSSDLPRGRVILKAKRRSLNPKKEDKKEVEKLATLVFEGIRLEPPTPEKTHQMMTRQDVAVKTPKLNLRSRQVIRDSLKRAKSPASLGPPKKFIALAEQVHHFFVDTPPRFRNKTIDEAKDMEMGKRERLRCTVPQSPHLRTKERARSVSPVRNDSHSIRALPLNPKVFQPPDMSLKPAPKETTVPQPFNLTYVPKKEVSVPTECSQFVQFKAQPVPKSCRNSVSSSISNISSGVTTIQRLAVSEAGSEIEECAPAHSGIRHLGTTNKKTAEVKPFSFDKRDRIAMQKKNQRIKMAREEAAKIPKFVARPVPSFISNSHADETRSVVSNTSRYHNHTEDVAKRPFKAKQATVLTKEPFVPRKSEVPLTDVTDIQLNTERRAKIWEERERDRQEREKLKQLQEEKRSQEVAELEKKTIKQLRQSMVPKPTAKPNFLKTDKH